MWLGAFVNSQEQPCRRLANTVVPAAPAAIRSSAAKADAARKSPKQGSLRRRPRWIARSAAEAVVCDRRES